MLASKPGSRYDSSVTHAGVLPWVKETGFQPECFNCIRAFCMGPYAIISAQKSYYLFDFMAEYRPGPYDGFCKALV